MVDKRSYLEEPKSKPLNGARLLVGRSAIKRLMTQGVVIIHSGN